MGVYPASKKDTVFFFINSASIFLFFALSLSIKSGYSYGPALLILFALFSLPWWAKNIRLQRAHYWFLLVLLLSALVGFSDAIRAGADAGDYNRPARYLACMLLFVYFTVYPPRARWIWWGVAIGAIGAGVSAIYYTYFNIPPVWRAAKYLNPIQFGDSAALLATLCLCGLVATYKKHHLLFTMLILGALLALVASILSESRGSWLALMIWFVVLIVLALFYFKNAKNYGLILVGFLLIVMATFFTIGGETTLKRINEVTQQISLYTEKGQDHRSIGARLSMWRFGLHEGMSYPIFGANRAQMLEDKKVWVAEGRAGEAIVNLGHLHNEFIDRFAITGIVGLVILLALFLYPLGFFLRKPTNTHLHDHSAEQRILALKMAGVTTVIMHMGFGLTQVSLNAHNSGFMLYVIPVSLFFALLAAKNTDEYKLRSC
ncbi:O-antigen ligase family protein [Suttonella sp. R2A3]|uniref:O-antigen ligase family protein n=1 Tax=Suttonella sp. R2A3 TaxID=2908648 RepID=UPI001F43BB6E|nr:O-antigen ligase family protein [Suttonella sp. R2A3]UJF23808.1 O-antigen ligase family protein [Suttonella sp. R2A3]